MFSTTPCFAVDMSNASRLLWFANITLPPGRSKRCDVIVNDSRVSSVHCRIYKGVEQDDGSHQILIEDTSSNGTKIQRAGQDMMEVSPGEKEALKHGDMVFLVHTDKNPSDSVSLRVDPLSPTDSSSDGGDGGGGATASAGDLAFGRYRVLKSLGSGSFALVKLGFDVVSNQLVALKYIDKQHFFDVIHTQRPEARTAEVDLLKQIRHENVVAFIDEHQDEEHIVLVLEYVSGGELFDYIIDNGRMEEELAKTIFRQLATAVAYLHGKGIVHRDLKPENILLHTKLDGSLMIKVTDFGLSRLVPENSFMQSVAGSPGYFAPEVMLDASHGYTKKVDVWSIGVILYILLSAVPPYDPQIGSAELARRSIRFPQPQFAGVSSEAKDLILQCLDTNVETRPTAVQVLNHRWLATRPLRRLASASGGGGDMSAPSLPTTHVKRKRVTEL
eukprot:INCI4118.2.p1 GENE.INCI4118.2~~INCI4118.2.p1  ORF type:complete len:445 (+),score=88.84 INCI4118.2:496-1830(+)